MPIHIIGTTFQQSIWQYLQSIPYGTTVSYGYISQQLFGNTHKSRAIGNAVSHNPLSIVVPCHRVLGSLHNLVGFAGGLENKQRLLELEAVSMLQYF
jgi:methylated-DNA-[protein]-cysteine S-methyltransferase